MIVGIIWLICIYEGWKAGGKREFEEGGSE